MRPPSARSGTVGGGGGSPAMTSRLSRLALLLLLTGCASDQSLTDRLAGRDRVRGDRDTVAVSGFGSVAEALPLAVGHCARFGRSAQFDRKDPDGVYRFRCVS